ncbi:hypothetical protein K2173_001943 [Erythroxylum novogranatense]|uniref:Glycosyltransferase n=1 Tax=Erythroxylum novogranatense TaxID=1862640 RepID=A0AAV8SP71_9ROSI|nr:hypothetical protein K2173_001943 [Erythroxylum novogranatense]
MASQIQHLQFVLLPHLAQGHIIPMVDMARLLAQHGVTATIITTPFNAIRLETTIKRAVESGQRIELLQVQFPSVQAGLPEGCENMDAIPSRALLKNLLTAISMLQEPVERILHELEPPPSCIISDKHFPWTHQTSIKFGIPRLVFDGTSCFSLLCNHNILATNVHEILVDSESFEVPGLPDRIVLTKAQLPNAVKMSDCRDFRWEMKKSEDAADGLVVNTFEELESAYVNDFRMVTGRKVWCVGPVSLCNTDNFDKFQRGNKSSVDENECLNWLNSQETRSVVYVCLGSLSRLSAAQLIELGLGLKNSNRPFIWVLKEGSKNEELEQWISQQNFQNRREGKVLLIRGWSPQVMILSHPAVGGFLTHCGWNSTLEGLCAGVPMITWPLFAEQFYNERFIVQVLKVGVKVGAEFSVRWGEEEKFGVVVKREQVQRAVDELMSDGEEAEERRKEVRRLRELAQTAIETGKGSSYLNMALLIQDIVQRVSRK